MLLGYSCEPNSRALDTVNLVMTIGLSMKGCLHSKKPGSREITRLTSPEVWNAVTSKA